MITWSPNRRLTTPQPPSLHIYNLQQQDPVSRNVYDSHAYQTRVTQFFDQQEWENLRGSPIAFKHFLRPFYFSLYNLLFSYNQKRKNVSTK